MILSNTAYRQLPAKALAGVLRDAKFEVEVQFNLTSDSLTGILEQFLSTARAGGVYCVYYSGYLERRGDDYLLPIDYDPASNENIYNVAFSVSRLQKGLASKQPPVKLSLIILDANWEVSGREGRMGLGQPTPAARTWLLSSNTPNRVTTQIREHMGLFTAALVRFIPQPGLDVTDLVAKVRDDVEATSNGGQHLQAWSADVPRFYFHEPVPIGKPQVNSKDRMQYVYIPEGKFWMGCAPASEKQCEPAEKPQHLVEITQPFWLGQTEVTYGAWQRYLNLTKTKWKHSGGPTNCFKADDLPVCYVSWADAQRYCHWAGGRLPTEAEWERAARDGRDHEVYPYPDVTTSRDKANFQGNSGNDQYAELAPVGKFDPTPNYKLFDMAGNVWEWVQDLYNPTYYEKVAKQSPAQDPQGPDKADKGIRHVVRGGSWASAPQKHLRISYREGQGGSSNNVGFRCMLRDTPEVKQALR
ncbi:MAG: SUMF1/EgtB/PvdO family nonheme iron enzyme [Acidobacteriia bacterium]|nr:SUMF1/EgtB/PvdO family nonheme iron enzyme [Terriglobia bacterium]